MRALRGPAGRLPRDDGSATLEITVLAPAVLLVVFGIVQGAFFLHARNVALAAASEGLAATAMHDGRASDGSAAARDFLTAAGADDVLLSTQVVVHRTETEAEVTVTGLAPSLVPGVRGWSVSQTAAGPVERFTSEERP